MNFMEKRSKDNKCCISVYTLDSVSLAAMCYLKNKIFSDEVTSLMKAWLHEIKKK